jgi:hypothetical protein
VAQHSLYEWVRKYSQLEPIRIEAQSQQAELRRLKAELMRVTEERGVPKIGRPTWIALWPAIGGGTQPRAAAVRRDGAESGVDDRHHLHLSL